ncbi:hypothetical protein CAPTEDRAFT_178608 [Capitella teleta]|uniref:Serpin domain-containing protein n=1 Tax=Capitella teleta TaxID=283909 RepID=R7TM73_CAPTE|nr:hypothetical protein CAPTEDRAFT_178608 [Capitella teleta]|eukprot:ELT94637.1 hypothetical protein CAPTEDRAFT_178608 [Capitella teleta]
MLRTLVVLFCLCSAHASDFSDANNEFALSLYGSMAEEVDDGNLFFSPISVSLALGMTRAGAMADTKSQMSQVLALDEMVDADISASFKELISALNREGKNFTLDIANRLFGRQDYVFDEAFLNECQENFMSQLEELDFAEDTEGSRTHINDWVAEQTQQKIKDLIPEGAINKETALVLVNAIYFKGLWKIPFEQSETESLPFHAIHGVDQPMEMMQSSDVHFNYKEDKQLNIKILELPYEDDDVSMFVLLPDDEQGLLVLEEDLVDSKLTELFSGLREQRVKVALPKFQVTQSMSLKSLLVEMGMEDLFNSREADLSGINGKKDLYVTEVVHKAFIQVDEEGTEAAASTGVLIGLTAVMETPEFIANHPFMYVIWEKSTSSALFMGRLTRSTDETQPLGAFGVEYQVRDTASGVALSLAALCACLVALWI